MFVPNPNVVSYRPYCRSLVER